MNKNIKIKIHLLIFLLLLLGCDSNNSDKNQVFPINIKDGFSSSCSLPLSKIASKIEYFYPESSKESLISKVGKIVFDTINGLVLIQDKLLNKILIFDKNGKFLTKINKIGEAPFEYKRIGSWCYSSKSKYIYLLDDIQFKILTFDLSGNFINYFKVPKQIVGSSLFCVNSNLVVFIAKPLFILDKFYSFILFDSTGRIIKRFHKNPENCCKLEDAGVINYFYNFNNRLNFSDSSNDTVFEITSNFFSKPKYTIVTNDEPIDLEITKNWSKYLYWLKNHNAIDGIIETNSYIFFSGTHNMFTRAIFYKKTNNFCCNVVFDLDIYDHGFYNDIDGCMPFWPKGVIDDRTLFQIIEPLKLKEIINSTFYDTVRYKSQKQHNEIIKYLNSSSLETNPFIAIVTLK